MRAGDSSLRWDSPLRLLLLAINELSCHGKVVGSALSLLAIALYAQTLTLPPSPSPFLFRLLRLLHTHLFSASIELLSY